MMIQKHIYSRNFSKKKTETTNFVNQKITLSMHELKQKGEKIDAIRRITLSKFEEHSNSGKRKKEVTAWFQFRIEWSKS